MIPTVRRDTPFRRDGLLRRTAPFLVAMIISFAAIRLPAVQRDDAEIIAAGALNLALIALVWLLPWQRLPAIADLLPPLGYMVVIALLRDGLGGQLSAFSPLLTLPILWLAMYGTRPHLAVGVLAVGVLLSGPLLIIGEPEYGDEEWRRALLWVVVSGIMGLAVQDLVDQVRQRADALHTVSEAMSRRTREIETRAAICEAAKKNARADFALMLEPDANGRRLVATAATDPDVERTELFLTDTQSAGVQTYRTGREYLDEQPDVTKLGGFTSSAADVSAMLWHPVPGRGGAMGVLAVAWRERPKRLPETLPAVMEALAVEAAGVIERTTLLLKLEDVVKTDEVTGLPNERAWEEEVTRELSRARREGRPLSVAILDLGRFDLNADGKVGSRDARLLRAAADAWRRELRPADFLAHRRSPGRFAALLPNLAADDADATAVRLRELAPAGRECSVAAATWNGIELPAALVARAERQIELDRAT